MQQLNLNSIYNKIVKFEMIIIVAQDHFWIDEEGSK